MLCAAFSPQLPLSQKMFLAAGCSLHCNAMRAIALLSATCFKQLCSLWPLVDVQTTPLPDQADGQKRTDQTYTTQTKSLRSILSTYLPKLPICRPHPVPLSKNAEYRHLPIRLAPLRSLQEEPSLLLSLCPVPPQAGCITHTNVRCCLTPSWTSQRLHTPHITVLPFFDVSRLTTC